MKKIISYVAMGLDSRTSSNHSYNPWSWNGSYLGSLASQQVNYMIKGRPIGTYYMGIRINGYFQEVVARSMSNFSAILIDQLRSSFGLNKLGTHGASYRGKRLVIIKGDSYQLVDQPTSEWEGEEGRKVVAINWLLTVGNGKGHVLASRVGLMGNPEMVSLFDSALDINNDGMLTSRCIETWFVEAEPIELVRSMLFSSGKDDNLVITTLTSRIESLASWFYNIYGEDNTWIADKVRRRLIACRPISQSTAEPLAYFEY